MARAGGGEGEGGAEAEALSSSGWTGPEMVTASNTESYGDSRGQTSEATQGASHRRCGFLQPLLHGLTNCLASTPVLAISTLPNAGLKE